jgi:hypothetical protein
MVERDFEDGPYVLRSLFEERDTLGNGLPRSCLRLLLSEGQSFSDSRGSHDRHALLDSNTPQFDIEVVAHGRSPAQDRGERSQQARSRVNQIAVRFTHNGFAEIRSLKCYGPPF